ncbi:alpha/beta hydrolase [Chloroflexota bacterium]
MSNGISPLIPTCREKFFTEGFIKKHPEHIDGWEKRFLSNSIDDFLKTTEANLTRPRTNTHRLSEIRTPILIVVGDQDVVTPHDIAVSMNEGITNSQLAIVTNCGHIYNEEQPGAFNSIVEDFLARI